MRAAQCWSAMFGCLVFVLVSLDDLKYLPVHRTVE